MTYISRLHTALSQAKGDIGGDSDAAAFEAGQGPVLRQLIDYRYR